MQFNFDAVFHKKPYPKHLASSCPCNTCEFGGVDELCFCYASECVKCVKYITWTTDCICKLGEMERKYEEELK